MRLHLPSADIGFNHSARPVCVAEYRMSAGEGITRKLRTTRILAFGHSVPTVIVIRIREVVEFELKINRLNIGDHLYFRGCGRHFSLRMNDE
jgi:hypothetical protein